jgi:hypothetical protein
MAAYSPNVSPTSTRVNGQRARQLFENIMRQRSGDARRTYRILECVAKPLEAAELVERVSRMLNANTHSEERPRRGPC